MTPEELVDTQLAAYNAHDINAFMATYSPTVQFLRFPSGEAVFADYDVVRKEYEEFFREAPPHVEIGKRITRGSFVIDHELGSDPERGQWEAVAIYEVENDLIQRVWFIPKS